MDYYTLYSFEAYKDGNAATPKQEHEIMTALSEINCEEFDDYFWADRDYKEFSDINVEPIKWYYCEINMEELGKRFPDYTFIIIGLGDDRADMWVLYINGDIMERVEAEIVLPRPAHPNFEDCVITKFWD